MINPRDTTEQGIEKFWVRVNKTAHCWNWAGRKVWTGYGFHQLNSLYRAFKTRSAHRTAYLISGNKIPKGKMLDHVCRNRLCVNPKHLRPVSPWENTVFNSQSPPALNKKKKLCKRGHKLTEVRYKTKYPKRKCITCSNADSKRYRAARKKIGEGENG